MTMRAFGAGDRDKVGRAHVADLDCLVGDHARAAKSAVSRIRDALSGQFMPAGIPACQRPAAGRPERHKVRDAGPRRSSAGDHHNGDGGNQNLHEGLPGEYADELRCSLRCIATLRAYYMTVNAVDLQSLSCRNILSVIKMRAGWEKELR
jgi:hypothetical protein